jgi:type II secretory pathway pseudopilin PulG
MTDECRPMISPLPMHRSAVGASRSLAGFTLLEMLTTVAALIILMGLAVSLAREVRRRSADELTRDVLAQLDIMLRRYEARHDGAIPAVAPLIPVGPFRSPTTTSADSLTLPDAATLARTAGQNNRDLVEAFRRSGGFADELFGKLPRTMYDDQTLRDAWGQPIVFMPTMHPQIGMAEGNRPFFFSAGPDRDYLTREDNLYSYEGR